VSNTALPRFGDAQLQDLINRLEQALSALEGKPLANVLLLGPITIATTDTRVYHGLGRALGGYFVVRAAGDVRIFDGAVPETLDPANYVSLRSSNPVAVTLAVF